jgi:hypothetical protein
MKKFALVLAALGLSSSAFALESGISETGISYNEVSVGYGVEGDTDSDYKGLGVGINALLSKNIYAFGQFKNPSTTISTGKVDTQQFNVGLGTRAAIASNADLYASVSYLNAKYSYTGGSMIVTGYSLATGVRAIIAPQVEGSLNLSYYAGKSREESNITETRYGVGLGYHFTDKVIGRTSYYMTPDSIKGYSVSLGYKF